jgi:hypothetical protein
MNYLWSGGISEVIIKGLLISPRVSTGPHSWTDQRTYSQRSDRRPVEGVTRRIRLSHITLETGNRQFGETGERAILPA